MATRSLDSMSEDQKRAAFARWLAGREAKARETRAYRRSLARRRYSSLREATKPFILEVREDWKSSGRLESLQSLSRMPGYRSRISQTIRNSLKEEIKTSYPQLSRTEVSFIVKSLLPKTVGSL